MSIHKPPTSDTERLENLLAAWGSPDNDAFEDDDEAIGDIDFDAWAAEIRAKVQTHVEAERRARAAAEAAAKAAAARGEGADFDALVRAQVDRATAPYVGIAPPVVLAKLRELAERYWRETPSAISALRMQLAEKNRIISGVVSRAPEDEKDEAAGHGRKA